MPGTDTLPTPTNKTLWETIKAIKSAPWIAVALVVVLVFGYQNCRKNYWESEATSLTAQLEMSESVQKVKDKKTATEIKLLKDAAITEQKLRISIEKDRAKIQARADKAEAENKANQAHTFVLPPDVLLKEILKQIGEHEAELLANNFYRFTLKGAQNSYNIFLDRDYWKGQYGLKVEDNNKLVDKNSSLARELGGANAQVTKVEGQRDDYKGQFSLCKKNNEALQHQIGKDKFVSFAKGFFIGGGIVLALKLLSIF